MLRALSRGGRADALTILRSVNELLAADLGDARFVTCFFGLLDPLVNSLSYASAGHGPLLFYRSARDAFEQVSATSVPLGILADAAFDEAVAHAFAPGDFAVITTDGFFEAFSPTGEAFGIERMTDLLRRDRALPGERMIANLHEAVRAFAAGQPQQDDLTAVVIRRK
jgi:sigma-B regulation protein RsbU (phosphoserine phosphatase)